MSVCRGDGGLSFSRKDLAELLVFYNMKPLPLDNVVRQLEK